MPGARPYFQSAGGNRRRGRALPQAKGFIPAGERKKGTSLPTPILAGLFATLSFNINRGKKTECCRFPFQGNQTGGRVQKALASSLEAKAVRLLNRVNGGVIFRVASTEAGKITPAVRSPNTFANARLDKCSRKCSKCVREEYRGREGENLEKVLGQRVQAAGICSGKPNKRVNAIFGPILRNRSKMGEKKSLK